MERMPLPDMLFLVCLAVLGVGATLLDRHTTLGVILIAVGAIGAIVCMLEHLKDPASGRIRLTWSLLGRIYRTPLYRKTAMWLVGLYVGVSIAGYALTLRSDLDTYVMPRKVTSKQADDLRDFLARHPSYSVTVKVNPLDQEATEYWAELSNSLNRTEWKVELNTSADDPNTLNPGLCIGEVGSNSRPSFDPKKDPRQLLQQALQSAHIEANCGSSIGAGQYKLFLLIGHRPLKIGEHPPLRFRLARWLMQTSQPNP